MSLISFKGFKRIFFISLLTKQDIKARTFTSLLTKQDTKARTFIPILFNFSSIHKRASIYIEALFFSLTFDLHKIPMTLTSNSDPFYGMMTGRKEVLDSLYSFQQQHHIDFIMYAKELQMPFQYNTADDIGMFWMTTHLGNLFQVTDIFGFYQIFMLVVISITTLISYYGILKSNLFYKVSFLQKIVSFMAVFLLWILISAKSDVYAFYFISLCTIPIIYFYGTTEEKPRWGWIIIGVIIMSLSEFSRSQSGNIGIVFLLLFTFILSRYSLRNKLMVLALTMCIFLGFKQFVKYKNNEAVTWMKANVKDYDSNREIHHPYWHSIYIGLGYVQNDHGIEYLDSVAIKEVAKVNKTCIYGTDLYEDIIKEKYFNLWKSDPVFILKSYSAKCGLIFLLVCFLCLPILYQRLLTWRIFWVFGLSIGFASLSAILVYPRINYLISVIVISLFGGLMMWNKKVV
jgi:hypothetical protein